MLPLEDALAQMLNQLPFPTKTETLALTEAADRVCAEDVISPINVPSFDNSATCLILQFPLFFLLS